VVALGYASMICLHFSSSESKLDPASDSKDFTSATNDFFERHSMVLCKGILWNSHHFPVSFFVFPLSFVCGLDWLSYGCPSLPYPFSMGWGHLLFASTVRGLQTQIATSFV
jgi:hypothetical protein